jgi:chorismate mutase/prephenate dehydratase
MFVKSDLVIVAEREEPIIQNLFSVSGDIKKVKGVYSHPQALAQCRKWLEARLPHASIHETLSTADAAVHATLDPTAAAIASQAAGEIYHLRTVASKIEDSVDNTTRFLVIGKDITPKTGKDKTSVMFSVKDRVGALYDTLQVFKKANLNMTKIESRPTKKKVWEYIFFVDFIGHQTDKKVQKALAELRRKCAYLKVLGSYPYGA